MHKSIVVKSVYGQSTVIHTRFALIRSLYNSCLVSLVLERLKESRTVCVFYARCYPLNSNLVLVTMIKVTKIVIYSNFNQITMHVISLRNWTELCDKKVTFLYFSARKVTEWIKSTTARPLSSFLIFCV